MPKKKSRKREARVIPVARVRVSKMDTVTTAATQEVIDLSTADIIRRRTVLQCDVTTEESHLNELLASVALSKEKLARAWAVLAGFNQAIEKRCKS